jgi:hypothetical protein
LRPFLPLRVILAAVIGDAFRCLVMPARRRRSGFQAIAGFEDP